MGSAGGYQDLAGGETPLGIFADDTTDDEQLLDIVEQVVRARFVAGLNLTDPPSEAKTDPLLPVPLGHVLVDR